VAGLVVSSISPSSTSFPAFLGALSIRSVKNQTNEFGKPYSWLLEVCSVRGESLFTSLSDSLAACNAAFFSADWATGRSDWQFVSL
jgi:hypothetical protein